MKLPEINTAQRVLLILSALVLIFYQLEQGEDGFAISLIIVTTLLAMALSGGVKIIIPAMIKTVVVVLLGLSICANIAQYIYNKEARNLKAKYLKYEYDEIIKKMP